MLVNEIRREAIELLRGCGAASPEADAGLVIMDALGIDKTKLLLGTTNVSDDKLEEIRKKIQRIAEGEPVQYVVGRCEFMSLLFNVERGVLIPRADTEILVEAVLGRLESDTPLKIADICSGSGCIGISLAYYMKNIMAELFDISDVANFVARQNAEQNGVSDRVTVRNKDVLSEDLDDNYACIVSNPPYIKSGIISSLNKNVKDFEPRSALDGGESGLVFYERIAELARLTEGGLLAFEIGFDQGQEVSDIMSRFGYCDIEIIKDLENRDRVVLGRATKSRTENVS